MRFFAFLGLAASLGPASLGCTTFAMTKLAEPVVGKSYDWHLGHGMVLVNKRGQRKKALHLTHTAPLVWESKFGSVTFNQYGREMPLGGMNEAGLVIEVMWLDKTQYPPVESAPAVNEAQWIQYHLDRFENVRDVVRSAGDTRILPIFAKVHYLVCDRSAQCAAIEFLNGELQATVACQMPASVLSNHTFPEGAAYLKQFKDFGGTISEPALGSFDSLDRFARAAIEVKRFDPTGPTSAVDYAFQTLDKVRQGTFTQFNLVYELSSGRIHFRTQGEPAVKSVQTSQFDYTCRSPARILDMNQPLKGDVTSAFSDYSKSENRRMIELAFKDIELPPGAIDRLASYPDGFTCAE